MTYPKQGSAAQSPFYFLTWEEIRDYLCLTERTARKRNTEICSVRMTGSSLRETTSLIPKSVSVYIKDIRRIRNMAKKMKSEG